MKEDVLYQTTRGNMVFSVYMRRSYKHDIALLAKKQRYLCPEKIHLGLTSPASPKKIIFMLENMIFFPKYHIIDTLERAQYRVTADVLQERLFFEISQNSQKKTCARASFLIKLQA